jgi:hypothetical protein
VLSVDKSRRNQQSLTAPASRTLWATTGSEQGCSCPRKAGKLTARRTCAPVSRSRSRRMTGACRGGRSVSALGDVGAFR